MSATGPGAGAIDVHAHCVPTEVVHRLASAGDRYGVAADRVKPALMDVHDRVAAMDEAGVGAQLLSGWMDLAATAVPAEAAPGYARMFNEALAGVAAEAPDRLKTLANVPLHTPAEAAAELRHAVLELGMVGAEIGTTAAGAELDAPELEPFWEAAEELRCLLLLHPCSSLAGRGVTRYGLNNLVGNPAETTIAVGHLVFGGVLERHPGLRLLVVHGGGFAPYQVGRWDHAFHGNVRGAAANLTRPPSHWLRQMYHDTVLHSPRPLELLLDLVGADHVVLGSDYPFEMGVTDPCAVLDAVPGLSAEQRAQVSHGNVERLLAEVAT